MAESIALDMVTEKVLGYLGSTPAAERLAPYFGGSDELERLEDTLRLIQARLIDAEKRQEEEEEGGAAINEWLRRLKRVLYMLEDFIEDIDMVLHEREQMGCCLQTNLVRLLTFEFDCLGLNKRVFREFKVIMGDLEIIKLDMAILDLRDHHVEQQCTITNRFDERKRCYCMSNEVLLVGRENDRKVIVEMLLDSDSLREEGVSVSNIIPIVGIGGLGKTTLAQICFNGRVGRGHFDFNAWVCVSAICSFKELLVKILASISSYNDCHNMSMEELEFHIRAIINARRYLLVLDDAWVEDCGTWLNLMSLLSCGKRGSKIIVTTRSHVVVDAIGIVKPYHLQCLDEEVSWTLFESLAFDTKERSQKLTSIGREIVKKCMGVPLAIKVIASLLYYKHGEEEWEHFKDNDLKMIGQDNIMSILKLSYDHLQSPLKQCFAYSSLFPKDYTLEKEQLIWIWMAQGFIRPSRNRSLKDTGD